MANLTVSSDVDAVMGAADNAAIKTLLSLNNVDNTSDVNKPVSTATQTLIADATRRAKPQTMLVGAVGNSLIENSSNFLRVACSRSNGKMVYVKDTGTGGALSSALAAQVASLPSSVNTVFVFEGTNDAEASVTPSTYVTNMAAAVTAILARGMHPIVVAAPPRDTTSSLIASYVVPLRIWAENNKIEFYDPWGPVLKQDGTGQFASNISSDGDHPNAYGHSLVGQELASLMAARTDGPYLPRLNAGEGILSNVMQTIDTDGNGLPDGWTNFLGEMAGTFSLATGVHPQRGKACTAICSQTTIAEIYKEVTLSGALVGKRLRLGGFVSMANSSNVVVRIYFSHGNTVFLGTENVSTQFISAECVPANTSMQIWIEMSSRLGGAFTCDLSWGGFDLYLMN